MIESAAENLAQSQNNPELAKFENSLRPKKLSEYVGQRKLKDNLMIAVEAAKKRGEPLDHVLLHGAPGLGKTTLAHIIGHEIGADVKITSGPALEKQGDIASIISNMNDHDILFIDEIHRLKPVVEEVLYTAMEDYAIDIVIGQGPSAKTVRLDLPKFTLVGATTKMNMISSPLRDRFGAVYRLNFYNDQDIYEIVMRSSKILGVKMPEDCAKILASSCRRTPRIANRLLKRVRDYVQVKHESKITEKTLRAALSSAGIDELGLDHADREILEIIIDKFGGGPVGLNTLSAAINEDQATIEDIYEPFLIQMGFLERTARGRIATEKAYQHMGLAWNENSALI